MGSQIFTFLVLRLLTLIFMSFSTLGNYRKCVLANIEQTYSSEKEFGTVVWNYDTMLLACSGSMT